jgi:hypothetical protein
MGTRSIWLALVLATGWALAAGGARGQEPDYATPSPAWLQPLFRAQEPDYTAPDPVYPLPLFHDHPERGGLYVAAEFVMMEQTNPLAHQVIARRGLFDFDGSITAALNGQVAEPGPSVPPIIIPGQIRPGNFIGSGTPALFADDAGGPGTFQPGFNVILGWRFASGFALEVSWMHLQEAKYAASAGIIPPTLQPGNNLEETFVTAPVFNFPNDYAGPQFKLAIGNPNAAFGIWNAASNMEVIFIQRYEQVDVTGRIPIYQGENCRCYGLVGPRMVWMWEKFYWRTVAQDFLGNAAGDDSAIYTNVVSQRFYGVHAGGGMEWHLCDTPAGTFSISCDLQVAGLVDVVKERAKYERGDFETSAQRARTEFTFSPELQAQPNLWWYPIEGVQLRVGYDVMGFFNTVASPNPVSFNYGGLDPPFEKGHFRFFNGFNAGIGFIF